jgi:hypothetical protein
MGIQEEGAMRIWVVVLVAAAVTACGQKESVDDSPEGRAAAACEAELKRRLGDKLYELDTAALAASMQDAGNGAKKLAAPVTTEPGLTSEAKQIMECTVRFAEGKEMPDIVGFGFNW